MKAQVYALVGWFSVMLASAASGASTVHYVDVNSTNPVSPFLDWSSAATNIQQAVNAGAALDVILVADGIYRPAQNASTTLSVSRNVEIHSLNGPDTTIIEGATNQTLARGVDLNSQCVLDGFTIRQGGLTSEPSGVRVTSPASAVVTNCIIAANRSGGVLVASGRVSFINCAITNNGGPGTTVGTPGMCSLTNCTANGNSGVGISSSLLFQCVVSGNLQGGVFLATAYDCQITNNLGRGANLSSLHRCLVMGNSSTNVNGAGIADAYAENSLIISNHASGTAMAGAVYSSTSGNSKLVNCTVAFNSTIGGACLVGYPFMTNCIIFGNQGPGTSVANNFIMARNCCTTPAAGRGCFTNEPRFMDEANGDFRLQPDSPCINAGFNPASTNSVDYAGNARIVGGTVDVGAYEYQTRSSVLSYVWAQTYGVPTDGSADFADPDGDGMNNWQECQARTNPGDAGSVLKLLSIRPDAGGTTVSWQTVDKVSYYLQRSTNLALPSSFITLKSNIDGQFGSATYRDFDATGPGPFFYRVGVQ